MAVVIGGVGGLDTDGISVIADARHLHPTALDVAAVQWGDLRTSVPIFEAVAVGRLDMAACGMCHDGPVVRWRCPACDREFSRTGQSHVCLPGNTVDQTFAGRPAVQREIYEAIVGHLRTLGPVYVDAVRVGVFLSHVGKIAEVRPMTRWVRLHLLTPRDFDDERIRGRERISASRFWYVINLISVSDVDDQLRDWLSEAYDSAG